MAANYSIKLTSLGTKCSFSSRKVAKVRIFQNNNFQNDNFETTCLVVESYNQLRKINNANLFKIVLLNELANEDIKLDNLLSGFNVDGLSHLRDGDIIVADPRSKVVRTIFRPDSKNNTIFTTERCNSNCLMCSQPPKDKNDDHLVQDTLQMLDLIETPPESLGITGGEPLILKNDLITILKKIKDKFPSTHVHMLTNGRYLSYDDVTREIGKINNYNFMLGIPLYSDVAELHDYVVQSKGAFDQTIIGIYNANKNNIAIEIRIVLHKQTIPRLKKISEYIVSNLPFVKHVALMGLENMGYVKKNWDSLWIDPHHYSSELESAVKILHYNRFNISIYNLQLCILPKPLWFFARKSISDYKNIYIDECNLCAVKNYCSGLFSSSMNRHSDFISAQKI